MSFADILRPRKDVLSGDGVEGIVDIENLRDAGGKHWESKPREFLNLTYPTSDIRFVLENLHQRFTNKARSAGLYLFEGYKGSGKSHLLLLVYHLALNRELAQEWLSRATTATFSLARGLTPRARTRSAPGWIRTGSSYSTPTSACRTGPMSRACRSSMKGGSRCSAAGSRTGCKAPQPTRFIVMAAYP